MNNPYLQDIEPTELLPEEMAEPLKAIVRIFDSRSIEIHKSNFWELIRRCSLGRHWPCFLDPSIALAHQKQTEILIDALYMELKRYEAEVENNSDKETSTPPQEHEEKEFEFLKGMYFTLNAFKGRVIRLNIEEVENPYMALKDFFSQDSPKNWKGLLAQWVGYVLGDISELKVFEKANILCEFEEFDKLLEAGYLLYIIKKKEYLTVDYIWEAAILKKYFGAGGVRYSSELESALVDFLKTVPVSRLKQNLQKVFTDFLHYNADAFPGNLSEKLPDIASLSELLDVAEKEQKRLGINNYFNE